jgi:sterol desaturase/sphingolipid hydroxylase (fatty acid hydroxylase superfamily)
MSTVEFAPPAPAPAPAPAKNTQAPSAEGTEEARERRRDAIVANIPAWYNPAIHLAIPTAFGLALMIAAALQLHDLRWLDLLAIPITLFASFGVEWLAHKDVLHKRRPLLSLLYVRHELMHHVIFTYENMAMRSSRELWLILMPAYAIVLVFAMVLPVALVVAHFFGVNTALLMVITSMAFFLSYEWLHMAYHMPDDSLIGRIPIIRRLREQHRRHHDPRLMKRWNFNVTFPVFDAILGTRWSPEREAEGERQRRRARRREAMPEGRRVW